MVIRSRSFIKDLFRSIWKTSARFLSIMAIIALGVGFFAGINATEPDMIKSADQYYQEHSLADFRIVSSLGFSAEDIAAVRAVDGVLKVQEGYSKDLFLTTASGNTATVRAYSYDPGEYAPVYDPSIGQAVVSGLNAPQIIEGRMPDKPGEIAIGIGFGLSDDMKIGSQLLASLPEGEVMGDVLRSDRFTIVGIISSPLYIDFERGQTNIGDGSIGYFIYLNEADFKLEQATDLFVRTRDSTGLLAYSEAYDASIEPIEQNLTLIGAESVARETGRLRDDLNTAKAELLDNRTQAEKELADGAQKLADAEQAILDGEKELTDQEKTYTQELDDKRALLEQGKEDFAQGKSLYAVQYARWLDGYNAWQASRNTLNGTKTTLDDALGQITAGEQELASAKAVLDGSKIQLDALKSSLDALNAIKASLPANVPTMTEAEFAQLIADLRVLSPELAQNIQDTISYDDPALLFKLTSALDPVILQLETDHAAGMAGYDQGLADYEAGIAQLTAQRAAYDQGMAAYLDGEKQLNDAKVTIDQGKTELGKAKVKLAAAEKKISSGEVALTQGEKDLQQSLADGRTKLDDARAELNKGQATYATEKADALGKIDDAQIQIRDAERQLAEIPDNWFIMPRSSFPGYSGYGDDARRIGAVAKIFPLFFFLVAALVCLTTMTRMVEEERMEIGTLKALGYGTPAIASKYLVYALLASLTGAVAGLLVGFNLLPGAIMSAYGAMYSIPVRLALFQSRLAYLSVGLAVLTTLAATLGATLQEVKAAPAVLMQPRAPKPGKRIFLERIGFLWRRLSFSQKVTARNLFRYKKRMLMTVLGIAGCTALLLSGFGLRDSVHAIMEKQFKEVFTYDAAIALDDDKSAALAKLTGWLDADPDVNSYLPVMNETVTAVDDRSGRPYEATLLVPAAGNEQIFSDFYSLHERMSRKKIELSDDGAVISEKLASLLGVRAGGSISVRDSSDHTYQIKITAVTENYLSHYIYMSPAAFDAMAYRAPDINTVVMTLKNPAAIDRDAFKVQVMDVDGVLGSMFVLSLAEDFQDTINSLDYVVIILIMAAGALAFVVLYNLTNINITERIREIATIKVLGFRDKEVSAYVYRENVVLTLIGTAAGLALGVFLHRFVIETMEIDTMMFGKTIQGLSYLYSVVLTFGFAILVNIFMYYKLRSVNMVESLKSID